MRAVFAVLSILAILAGATQGQTSKPGSVVLYAALGPELSSYTVNVADATLTKGPSVALPFAVQYAWPHPSKKFLYVAWSNGMQGDRHGITAYRVDAATGALAPHGQPIEIRHRPCISRSTRTRRTCWSPTTIRAASACIT